MTGVYVVLDPTYKSPRKKYPKVKRRFKLKGSSMSQWPTRFVIFQALVNLVPDDDSPAASLFDLVVKAWELDKIKLGLPNYRQVHPDANRIKVELVENKPLLRDKWVVRAGQNLFKPTLSGRLEFEDFLNGKVKGVTEAELKTKVLGLMKSQAFLSWQRDYALPTDAAEVLSAVQAWGTSVAAGLVGYAKDFDARRDSFTPEQRSTVVDFIRAMEYRFVTQEDSTRVG